jgi:hypothetical protein
MINKNAKICPKCGVEQKHKSLFFPIIKFILIITTIIISFIIGGSFGYEKGFRETAESTISKLGITATINSRDDYNIVLSEYIEKKKKTDIEEIFSDENIKKTVDGFVEGFVRGLLE